MRSLTTKSVKWKFHDNALFNFNVLAFCDAGQLPVYVDDLHAVGEPAHWEAANTMASPQTVSEFQP